MDYMIIEDVSTFLEVDLAVLVVEAGGREGQDQRWC